MGTNAKGASAPTNNGTQGAAGVEDDLSGLKTAAAQRRAEHKRQISNLFGGGNRNGGGGRAGGLGGLGGLLGGGGTGLSGLLGGGNAGNANDRAPESMVADTAGLGSSEGLPTASDSGEIKMVFRQVCVPLDKGRLEALADDVLRSTRTVLVLPLPKLMALPEALTPMPSRRLRSPKMCPAWVFRVSLWPPTPTSP